MKPHFGRWLSKTQKGLFGMKKIINIFRMDETIGSIRVNEDVVK
jgi:hypothetical protein